MASDVKTNILMAINWVKYSWEWINSTIIRCCFNKAYFKKDYDVEMSEEEHSEINVEPAVDTLVSH